GIVALEQMTERVVEDHVRARRLAAGLAEIPGLNVAPVSTNILYFSLADDVPLTAEELEARLKERGVLVLAHGERSLRAVTHYWIGDEDIKQALAAAQKTLTKIKK
ncbi:MAG: threonine aldolase, partial [Anaerolineae bacterium]|nr:threonine aldolase [Anaerolineae bacterium]